MDVVVASVVPELGESEEGAWNEMAKMIAGRRGRWCPRTMAGGDRRCGGGRRVRAEDEDVDWLRRKKNEDVREVCAATGRR